MSWASHHPTPADIQRVILAGLSERAVQLRWLASRGPGERSQGRKALNSEATLCETVAAMVQAAGAGRLAEVVRPVAVVQDQPLRVRITRVLRPRDAGDLSGMSEVEIGELTGAPGAAVYGELLYLRELGLVTSEFWADGVTRWWALLTPRDQMPPRGCGEHHAGECASEFPYNQREG